MEEVAAALYQQCADCGSEAGSYLRLMDFVHHSILGLRVIQKKKEYLQQHLLREDPRHLAVPANHRQKLTNNYST